MILLSFQHWRWRRVTDFTYGTSGKECYGVYNSTTQTGWGPGYGNGCIHSGTIAVSGDLPTNWYNYTLATAGTIIDENTTQQNPATNTDTATESICPKGWVLPSRAQTLSIGPSSGSSTYVSVFSPVLGGNYTSGGGLKNENLGGFWWSSDAYGGARRYRLDYSDNNLKSYYNGQRHNGYYIRCVQAP